MFSLHCRFGVRNIFSCAEAQPDIAGWSSLVARRAHNPEVVGSNPAPATKNVQLGGHMASELFLFSSISAGFETELAHTDRPIGQKGLWGKECVRSRGVGAGRTLPAQRRERRVIGQKVCMESLYYCR